MSPLMSPLSRARARFGPAKRRYRDDMNAATESIDEPRISASTRRVRRHRERRRANLRLFTVELPEANIENALIRELLKPEDRANAWPVIQGCYAAQLSDAASRWLINGGVITQDQRGDAAAILRRISDWLEQAAAR
jgi:hypothetical protein